MTRQDPETLRQELDTLRAELERSVAHDSPARPRIEAVLRDLENHLAESAPENSRADVLSGLRGAVRHFEAEHPRATAILNDIMVVLSNMGI